MFIRKTRLSLLIITVTSLFVVTAFAPSSASADGDRNGELKEPIEMTIPAGSGMTVEIHHSFGHIDITQGSKDAVHIKGEKRVTGKNPELAAEFLDAMTIRVTRRGSSIDIETYYPNQDMSERDRKTIKNFTITYAIEIPENTKLSVGNEFGNIAIGSVSGTFKITNGFGKVAAQDIQGDTEIVNRFGDIKAEKIDGTFTFGNEHGGIDARDITGDLIGNASHSNVEAAEIGKDVRIRDSFGTIQLSNITGNVDVITSFSKLECRNVGGAAMLKNMHGQVTADTIGGRTEIETKYAKSEARIIGGDLLVENEYGPVEAADIDGSIDANTSYAPIKIDRITGNITATSKHGMITVANVLYQDTPTPRTIHLKTSFSSINLTAPQSLSASLSAVTSFGDFVCDFPVTMDAGSITVSQSNMKRITGKIGEGRNAIVIENANGPIKLLKGGTPVSITRRQFVPKKK